MHVLGIDIVPMKPGSGTFPLPGIDIIVVDEDGKPVSPGKKGYLVIKKPWPGMLMTLWKDDEKYQNTYWEKFGTYIIQAIMHFQIMMDIFGS